jgi:hypothetical protein
MRAVICKLIYKRHVDKTRCLTGEFWVLFLNGEPAYRKATRRELVELLTGLE